MEVSILICTHGDSAWEELAYSRAYPSALGQSEHIVVQHLPDGTLAQSRNAAADSAWYAKWLLFLDADDELAPDYLEAMSAEASAIEWEYVESCGGICRALGDPLPQRMRRLLVPQIQYIHPNGREEKPRFPNRQVPMEEMNHAVIGTLVPRELFLEVGGFHEEPYAEDWALWLRCLRAGAEMVDVPAAVYRAFVRPEGRNSHERSFREQWYWRIRREHAKALAG